MEHFANDAHTVTEIQEGLYQSESSLSSGTHSNNNDQNAGTSIDIDDYGLDMDAFNTIVVHKEESNPSPFSPLPEIVKEVKTIHGFSFIDKHIRQIEFKNLPLDNSPAPHNIPFVPLSLMEQIRKLQPKPNLPPPLPPLFNQGNKWGNVKKDAKKDEQKEIPDLVILTGTNGSGKTQLLEYIATFCETFSTDTSDAVPRKEEVLYIDSSFQFGTINSLGRDKINVSGKLSNHLSKADFFNQIRSALQGHLPPTRNEPERLTANFIKKVCDSVKQEVENDELTLAEIDDIYLEQIVNQTLFYENRELQLKNPETFLATIVDQYENIQQTIYAELNKQSGLKLFEYYENLLKAEEGRKEIIENELKEKIIEIELKDFCKKIDKNKEFKKILIENYVREKFSSPIENINRILTKYKFKYEINAMKKVVSSKPSSSNSGPSAIHSAIHRLEFKDRKTGMLLEDQNLLSSGEQMVLAMVAWQYYAQGLGDIDKAESRQLDNKIKIMLLDEPDKHLDPKSCKLFYKIVKEQFVKNGIQVIIATHRIDTVMLAPLDSIYVIKPRTPENNTSIENVHKLQALFRMGGNLRKLIDYHHKVYVESIGDALFYEGAYYSLLKLGKLLGNNTHEINRALLSLVEDTENPYFYRRKLSNRYQLSFYSVSKENLQGGASGDGGCTQVKNSIVRDRTAIKNLALGRTAFKSKDMQLADRWKRSRKIFNEPELYNSYGILDNDYGTDHGLEKDELQEKAAILPLRHSVENYLFDPVIFCSMLEENEINECIKYSQIADADQQGFIDICHNIKTLLNADNINTAEISIMIGKYFHLIFSILYKDYEYKIQPKIQKSLSKETEEMDWGNEVLEYYLPTRYQNTLPNTKKSPIKKEAIPYYEMMKEIIAGNIDPTKCIPVKFINLNKKTNLTTFTLNYPEAFLKVRGHDIEELFFLKEKKNCNPAEIISAKIYYKELKFIPLDLADVFFQLNHWLRRDVTSVIKSRQDNERSNFLESWQVVLTNYRQASEWSAKNIEKTKIYANKAYTFFANLDRDKAQQLLSPPEILKYDQLKEELKDLHRYLA